MARETIGQATVGGVTRPIEIDEASGRFELRAGDDVAFMTFRRSGSVLTLIHTEVPPPFRGQHVGDGMVRAVLDFARARGMTIKPICPFVSAFLQRHPEYADLVDPAFGARQRPPPASGS